MTTDALLQMATARPWTLENIGQILRVNPQLPMAEQLANASLVCKAVTTFEAMREALRVALQHIEYDSYAETEATIKAALVLAEGT